MKNEFKLRNALNFRDIGGYESRFGGAVKRGVLFRSNSLAYLDPLEIDMMLGKNIKTVIDLRTDFEISRGDSRLKDYDGIEHFKISLMDNVHSQDLASFNKNRPESMEKLYRNLIDDSSGSIVSVFNTILERSENAIVFNCTAGKDRTGVIAALILDLLGVDKEDIFDNYVVTEKLMAPIAEKTKKDFKAATGSDMPEYLLESRRESIERFYKHLYEKYCGAKEYLLLHGFGQDNINSFMDTYLES